MSKNFTRGLPRRVPQFPQPPAVFDPPPVDEFGEPFVDSRGPGRTAAETTWRYVRAVSRKDVGAIELLLAPEIVVHTPLTSKYTFDGVDEVTSLLRIVFDCFEYLDGQTDIGDNDTRALRFLGRVNGTEFEESQFFWFDEKNRIKEAVLSMRPTVGLAAVTDAVGPRFLAWSHSRWAGRVAGPMLRLNTRIVAFTDRIVQRGAAPKRPSPS